MELPCYGSGGGETMGEIHYMTLQQHYGGRLVATRNGEVIASAETYDKLGDQLERPSMDWTEVVIEYVDPIDVIRV